MECFEHPATPAVGLCRSCCKAVCHTCAVVFAKGMACSAECEQDVKELIEMNERGKRIYGVGRYKTNQLASGVLMGLLLTAAMTIASVYFYFTSGRGFYTTGGMAFVFLVMTAISYRSSRRTGINC